MLSDDMRRRRVLGSEYRIKSDGRVLSNSNSNHGGYDFADDYPPRTNGGRQEIYVWPVGYMPVDEINASRAEQRPLKTIEEVNKPPKRNGLCHLVYSLDIGRKHDRSVCSVMDTRFSGEDKGYYLVRSFHTFKLKSLFSDIASQLYKANANARDMAKKAGLRYSAVFLVDASGLGQGAYDLIREKLSSEDVYPVYITTGDGWSKDESGELHFSKHAMIGTMIGVIEAGRLKFSQQTREVDDMISELSQYQTNVSPTGFETYSAPNGKYDDKITATAQAILFNEKFGAPTRMW